MPSAHGPPLQLVLVLDTTGVGGVEIVLLNTVRALNPAVVTSRLVCLRTEGDLGDAFRDAGCPVRALDRTRRWDVRTLPRLVAALRGADAVLLMHHQRAALTLGRVAASLAGVRVVALAVHATDLAAGGGRCLPRYVVNVLFLFSVLVLLNPGQADYLRRREGLGRRPWSTVPLRFIPNGVPESPLAGPWGRRTVRRELGLRDGHVVAGVVARLVPEKAHPVLLAAMARLRRSHPRLRLVVVGGGPEESKLRLLAAGYGIADQVVFTGPRSDVGRLLGAFDLFCLSSRTEAAPVAVLEAMTAGLPVVCTGCGELPEIVADGREGYVVQVDDDEAFARAMGSLAGDRALRERMGEAARDRAAREFGIDRTARAYEDMLTSLCTPKGAR